MKKTPLQAVEYLKALVRERDEEIERLREALQQVIDLPEDSRIHYKVARSALQQKDTE